MRLSSELSAIAWIDTGSGECDEQQLQHSAPGSAPVDRVHSGTTAEAEATEPAALFDLRDHRFHRCLARCIKQPVRCMPQFLAHDAREFVTAALAVLLVLAIGGHQ